MSVRTLLVLPAVIGAFIVFISRKAKQPTISRNNPKVMLNDIPGIEDSRDELVGIADFLKHPEQYQKKGRALPKCVLLIGTSDKAKRVLAKAIANEANVPFFSISGSELAESAVGIGASGVRELFTSAKKKAPAVIFIEDLDAVGGRMEGAPNITGRGEQNQALNQLLIVMADLDPRKGVVVLGSTTAPTCWTTPCWYLGDLIAR